MTRSEFLNQLKQDLSNDLDSGQVQENINYYDRYIRDEMGKGRSESEVVDELGDPWAIARNIASSVNINGGTQKDSGRKDTYEGNPDKGFSRVHNFSLDTRWKQILAVVAVMVVMMVVMSLISGLFSLLAPVLGPVMIILVLAWIIQMRNGRRRGGS